MSSFVQKIRDALFDLFTVDTGTPVYATGKWREFESRRLLLEGIVKHPISPLSQEQEGIRQAQCAHWIMYEQNYVTKESGNYLYVGAGRGSTQMTMLNYDGELVKAFNAETGYPKTGEVNIELLRDTALKVFEEVGTNVSLIVAFDSIFHVLKKNSPVIPDNGALPMKIKTFGKDFALGYLTDLYPNCPMLVVRNFIDKNGVAKKITWATGDELLIDLGTGNANLVDPYTGVQLVTEELPADWMTNDASLIKVGESVKRLLRHLDEQ